MSGGIKIRNYLIGFITSLALTLAAYFMVARHIHSHHQIYSDNWLIGVTIGLALVQFLLQVFFFLHLGAERKPRWNLLTFGVMAIVVFILVAGSLWIMTNLNYHRPANEANNYIVHDEGFGH